MDRTLIVFDMDTHCLERNMCRKISSKLGKDNKILTVYSPYA